MVTFAEDSSAINLNGNEIFSITGNPSGVTQVQVTQIPGNGKLYIATISGVQQITSTAPVYTIDPFQDAAFTFEPDPNFAGNAGTFQATVFESIRIPNTTFESETVFISGELDDAPTAFLAGATDVAVPEDALGGEYINNSGAFSVFRIFGEATDPDIQFPFGNPVPDVLGYSLVTGSNNFEILDRAAIDGIPGFVVQLKADAAVNFENSPVTSFTVRATDLGNRTLDQQFVLNVSDFPEVIQVGQTNNNIFGFDTASDANDLIIGSSVDNFIEAGEGSDDVFGLTGRDTIFGESGSDTLRGNEGNDLLNGGLDHDLLFGGDNNDILSGGPGDDTLFGESGNDDLRGGPGIDHAEGGLGNDTYIIRETADTILENPGEGVDRVLARADYTLPANVENLSANNGPQGFTLTGNEEDNVIIGLAGDDMLYGMNGSDVLRGKGGQNALFGGIGADILWATDGTNILSGGADDDSYFVRSDNASILEFAEEGTDKAYTIVDFLLAAGQHVEVLRAITPLGITLGGNEFSNTIQGAAGDDTIFGGGGDDRLIGRGGTDTFQFFSNWGVDVIVDFDDGIDMIDMSNSGVTSVGELSFSRPGQNVRISDGQNTIIIIGEDLTTITEDDFNFV